VAEGEEKTVGGFFRHVWNEFQSNIDYREYGEPVKSLPDATSELHMNQLLRLRLEAARIAVLRQDDGEYHRQLEAAREWLTENFQGERASELAAELGELNAVNLRPELPMLTASLDKLRELERTRPQEPVAPASPAPAAPPEAAQPATDSGADAS
jgi:uroporphyrin-3 C-methyltransferase